MKATIFKTSSSPKKKQRQKKHVFRAILLTPVLSLMTLISYGQNMFINGSMNGKVTASCDGNTNGTVADGWIITASSPDVNIASKAPIGNCSKWLGKSVASPDELYFESVISFGGPTGSSEGFAQTVSGLKIGKRYVFSYYWANTPALYHSLATPAVIVSGFENNSQLNPATASAPWKWSKHTVVLTATDSIATFDFRAVSQDIAYTSFDGVSLVLCNAGAKAPVPLKNKLTTRSELANLLPLQNNAAPFGSQFLWHTGTPGTIHNMVGSPMAVKAGSYYLTFYDYVNSCLSPTSSEVRIIRKK